MLIQVKHAKIILSPIEDKPELTIILKQLDWKKKESIEYQNKLITRTKAKKFAPNQKHHS